jgi:DNA/RNA endonuclease YhcR with UshA esterase domain
MLMRDYDISNEMTITGTIVKVERFHAMHRTHLQLTVTGGEDRAQVYVGPTDFIDPLMKFEKGDVVEIVGSVITNAGTRIVLARLIERSDKRLKLRDDDGMPLWTPPVFFEGIPEDGLRG